MSKEYKLNTLKIAQTVVKLSTLQCFNWFTGIYSRWTQWQEYLGYHTHSVVLHWKLHLWSSSVVVMVCRVCVIMLGIPHTTPFVNVWNVQKPLPISLLRVKLFKYQISHCPITDTVSLLVLLVSLGLLYSFAELSVFQAAMYKERKKRKLSNKFVYNNVSFRSVGPCIFCLVWVESVEINPMLFLLLASPETLWCEWLSRHHQIHQLDSKKCYPLLPPTQQMLRFL